jgi:hypothetical protein
MNTQQRIQLSTEMGRRAANMTLLFLASCKVQLAEQHNSYHGSRGIASANDDEGLDGGGY